MSISPARTPPLVADQIGPAAKRCGGNPAWDLPLVFGPIAMVYNLPGSRDAGGQQ